MFEEIKRYDPFLTLEHLKTCREYLDWAFPFEKEDVRRNLLLYCRELVSKGGTVRITRKKDWPFAGSSWHTYS